MSNLSELLPAGGAAKEFEAVASGTVPNSKAVILKANGQVEAVGEATTSPSMPLGTQTQFANRNTQSNSLVADPHNSNRWIIAWADDDGSQDVLLRVITLSGTTWTLSSEIPMSLSGNTGRYPAIAWDEGVVNKVLITYNNSSNDGAAKIGTISGSAGSESISFGSEHVYTTQTAYSQSRSPNQLLCLDTNGNYLKTFIGSTGYDTTIYGIILQVSSTTVTSGSETTLTSAAEAGMSSIAFVPEDHNKIIFGYKKNTTGYAALRQLTISATTITVGGENSGSMWIGTEGLSLLVLSATKVVMVCQKDSGRYPSYQILTNSSGTFSFGTFTTITSSNSMYIMASNNQSGDPSTFVLSYANASGTRYSRAKIGTINAAVSSVSFNSETQLSTTVFGNHACVSQQSDASGTFAYVFEPSTNNQGFLLLGQTGGTSTNVTSTNFVGIAAEAITSGSTGVVVPQGGVATNLSSLTIGSEYYVQGNGTISTASASPAVNIGKSISATSLILKG